MNSPVKPPSALLQRRALWVLLTVVSVALGWILWPFYGTILWGTIIALLFAPLYRWLLVRLPGRHNAAALLTLLAVVLIVILPLVAVIASLTREAATLYEQVQSGAVNPGQYFHDLFDALPRWVKALLDRLGLIDWNTLQRRISAALSQGTQFIATQALSIGQNTFEFMADLCITLYLAFFLIRDGAALSGALREAMPLAPAFKQELFAKFSKVIRAVVKGNLLVAVIQGTLGGVAFWFLDVSGALLWAVLMVFLSLLPAVGAGLVWAPVALYFFASGALWQAVALTAWGVLVIGLVDNVLRPILVGKDTRMPDYVVMITTLGGMAVFGINGFVIGPVIGAMFIAAWHIDAVVRRTAKSPPPPAPD